MMGSYFESARITLLMTMFIVTCSAQRCQRKLFFEDKGHKVTTSLIGSEEFVTLRQCQRMCHLYFECEGFIITWIGDVTEQRGRCQLLSARTRLGYVTSPGDSLFMTCPPDMTYDDVRKKCYSEPMETDGISGKQHCESLHPEAHVIHVKTAADQLTMQDLSGGRTMWLGIYHKPGGGRHYSTDFFYHGEPTSHLSYWKWGRRQPDGQPAGAPDCVISYAHLWYTWFDAPCTMMARVVCEF